MNSRQRRKKLRSLVRMKLYCEQENWHLPKGYKEILFDLTGVATKEHVATRRTIPIEVQTEFNRQTANYRVWQKIQVKITSLRYTKQEIASRNS